MKDIFFKKKYSYFVANYLNSFAMIRSPVIPSAFGEARNNIGSAIMSII